MRPAEVVTRAAGYLERHGVQSPRANAEILLGTVLGADRSALYARTEGLTAGESKALGRALCRRCAGTPLQHLTGEQGFRRVVLAVRPGVFVPRPETEVVVDVCLGAVDAALASGIEAPIVVDACTGSGAIALALKDERRFARVFGTDLSAEAVSLARANGARLGLEVEFLLGDLLEPLPPVLAGRVDLVVANPPYVSATEYRAVPVEVRADPRLAVVGGRELYERFFAQAAARLRPGGTAVVEIAESRGREVSGVAEARGFVVDRVVPDLNGRDRVVQAHPAAAVSDNPLARTAAAVQKEGR